MKLVHHLAIIAQPALVDGKHVDCPHCHRPAQVRQDGSALCIGENKSFAPESTDGELFTMRQDFDRQHGIKLCDRYVVVPALLITSGLVGHTPAIERLAMGKMLGACNHHAHA